MNTSHRIERRPGSKGEGPGVGPGERGGGGKKGNRGTPSGSKGKSSGFSPSMAKLPRSTRNTLLGLRSIKDPFDDDTEQVGGGFDFENIMGCPYDGWMDGNAICLCIVGN